MSASSSDDNSPMLSLANAMIDIASVYKDEAHRLRLKIQSLESSIERLKAENRELLARIDLLSGKGKLP